MERHHGNAVERSWRDLNRHHLAHHTFQDATRLTCAIHAVVKQLNEERQTPHPCGKLNEAAQTPFEKVV
jgi:hypothetical protein